MTVLELMYIHFYNPPSFIFLYCYIYVYSVHVVYGACTDEFYMQHVSVRCCMNADYIHVHRPSACMCCRSTVMYT